jgi:hypothetical protein
MRMPLPRTAATSIQVGPNSARPISGLENPTNHDMKLAEEAIENPIKDMNGHYACPFPSCQFKPTKRKTTLTGHLRTRQ